MSVLGFSPSGPYERRRPHCRTGTLLHWKTATEKENQSLQLKQKIIRIHVSNYVLLVFEYSRTMFNSLHSSILQNNGQH